MLKEITEETETIPIVDLEPPLGLPPPLPSPPPSPPPPPPEGEWRTISEPTRMNGTVYIHQILCIYVLSLLS